MIRSDDRMLEKAAVRAGDDPQSQGPACARVGKIRKVRGELQGHRTRHPRRSHGRRNLDHEPDGAGGRARAPRSSSRRRGRRRPRPSRRWWRSSRTASARSTDQPRRLHRPTSPRCDPPETRPSPYLCPAAQRCVAPSLCDAQRPTALLSVSLVPTKRKRRNTMRKILSALIAVSVLGIAAVPASALDAKRFWEDYDQTHSNG